MVRMVRNMSGVSIDFDYAVNFMDDDLCEEVHDAVAPCSEQDFFTIYELLYFAVFGELWEFSKENPKI